MSKGSKSTSTNKPVFAPQTLEMYARGRALQRDVIMPLEQQWIQGLGALGRQSFGQATGSMAPALSAGRQAQARLSSSLSDLPAHLAAPLEESLASQAEQLPQLLATMAPEELAQLVQNLFNPQFGGLLQPGQESIAKGGGPSSGQLAMGAGATAATIAAAAALIA